MKTVLDSFTQHPASVNETYFQHLCSAWTFAFRMAGAGCACFLHGLFPFLFVTTGSSTIRELYDRMLTNRAVQKTRTPVRTA
jgi:hypothetical protein